MQSPAELVGAGLLTGAEFRRFDRAERFFWSVRCHLHLAAGRAEERLSFDHQRSIAEAMRYADRPGKSAVERFMQFYFLQAQHVGNLTGVFLAQLQEQALAPKRREGLLDRFRSRKSRFVDGYPLRSGKLSAPDDNWFRAEKTGDFYGQCAELCGKEHAYMPIHVKVVTAEEYSAWVASKQPKQAAAPAATVVAQQ